MKTKIAKWLGILLIGLTGCYDYSNFDNIVIDPFSTAYVFPLINSKITFKDLAERVGTNSIVELDPLTNMYSVAYRDTLDLGLASTLFPINSISLPSQTFDFGGLIPPGFTAYGPITIPLSQTYNAIPGAEIKRIDFYDGTIQFDFINNYNHTINGNITITSLKNASNVSMVIPYSLISLESKSFSSNLIGYHLDLFELPNTYNKIKFSVTATITSSGNLSLAGNIAIQPSINSTNQLITGKIVYPFDLPNQTYQIGLFKSTILADQHIAEPKIALSFINSFGLPSSVNFTYFDIVNLSGLVPIVHEGPVNTGDLLIGSPNTIKSATASKLSDTTKLTLNASNSNIEILFDDAPKSLSFGASFKIGDAADPSHDYFIRSDSKFQLQSDIKIPLKGWVITNKIADTIPNIDWPNFENDFKLTNQKFRLKCKFDNGLPLDMYLQAYFLDQTGLIKVDSLFDSGSNWFIKSAPVNPATGESIGTAPAWSYISIDKTKYDKISQSKNMVLVFMFKTRDADHLPTPQNITILSTNSIAIEMSIEASGTVKP